MNKWEELLGKCGWQWWEDGQTFTYGANELARDLPPATLDNIFKYVLIKVPVLDRPVLLSRWVWSMYALEVDGDPANDLIDILYEAMV